MQLPVLTLLTLALRASALVRPYNVSEIDPFSLGRHHSLATDSPTTRVLQASPDLRERAAKAYPFFDALWATIAERRRTNHSQACNLRYIDWVKASLKTVKVRQIGEYSDDCHSRLDLADAASLGELDAVVARRARDVIVDVKDALWEAQRGIEAIPRGSVNWTRGAFALRDWQLRRVGQQCRVDNLFAYRVEGVWYVLASVANNPMDAFLPDWELATVFEYVREDLGSSLKLPWIRWGTEGVVEEGTTFLNRWGGKVSLASVAAMDFDDNPAVEEALRLRALAVDQAEDAVTGSNVAILALPMVLSLIPVAFVADLNGWAMLWYIVLTDVVAALPFLIKGVELVDTTKRKGGGVVAYHMGDERLGQMEVWAAECRGRDGFRVLGIVFVCIAVLVIVLGVALEAFAARVMSKRREEGGEGPFGMALFEATVYAPLGREGVAGEQKRLEREVKTLRERLQREGNAAGVQGVGERFEDLEEEEVEERRWKWWLGGWRRRRGEGEGGEEVVGRDGGNGGDRVSSHVLPPDVSYDTGVQRDALLVGVDADLGNT